LELEITEYSLEEQDLILTQYDKCMENKKILDVLLNPRQIEKLKSSILQDAIQWKLVSQDPSDEPASILIEKIQAEKAKLIAEWKLKKQKPLAPIKPEEIPYELPNGWEWVRLGEITNYWYSEKYNHTNTGWFWILELEDIEKTSSKLLRKVYFPERKIWSDKNVFKEWDILYNKLRPYLDKVVIADESGICTTEILPIRSYWAFVNHSFIRWILKSPYFISFVNSLTYGIKMPRLWTDDWKNAIIPLAPQNEQKRITEKIDELMKSCELLDEQIRQAKIEVKNWWRVFCRECLIDNFHAMKKAQIWHYTKIVLMTPINLWLWFWEWKPETKLAFLTLVITGYIGYIANTLSENQTAIMSQQSNIMQDQTKLQEKFLKFDQEKNASEIAKKSEEEANRLFDLVMSEDKGTFQAVYAKIRDGKRVENMKSLDWFVSEFEHIWILYCNGEMQYNDLDWVLKIS
jgi:hypothetical protein